MKKKSTTVATPYAKIVFMASQQLDYYEIRHNPAGNSP